MDDSPSHAFEPYVPVELQRRLQESAGRMKGERRQVTFLFADLVGSTALSQTTELELLKLLMDRALGTMIERVVAYEGMVARLSGDGLLAFFGAPLSHEDDSERAVRAALDIQANLKTLSDDVEQTYGTPLRARVGINAGEVVIGELGSDLRLEYTAIGPAINQAARLESAADAGGILVGEAVYRQTCSVFEFQSAGELTLRGFDSPVPAYAPLRAATSVSLPSVLQGEPVGFVGRTGELQRLVEMVQEVRSGRGQIALVLGEAGIGKSRLVFELHRRFADELRWAVGRSMSYATQLSFYPFVEVVRDLTGIEPADTNTVAALKLSRSLASLTAPERARHEPLLATLLKLPLDRRGEAEVQPLSPQATTQRLAEAIGVLIAVHCETSPLALVLDDLHWTDQASVELLERLLTVVETHPVLVFLVLRPDVECPAWPMLGHVHAAYFNRRLELDLRPLPEVAADELLEEIVVRQSLPGDLRSRLLERSGGNPLSLQELVRACSTRGESGTWLSDDLGEAEIPDTIQKIILSRFDRLPSNERALLQAASVLGRRFSAVVLEDVLGAPVEEALRSVNRADFVQERAAGHQRYYVFKHWLTQEAIYSTLLDGERKRLHARALEALEETGTSAAELARHALASDAGERSVELSLAAGDDDMRLLAAQSAVAHYRRALTGAERLGRRDLAFEAHARAGMVYMRVSNFASAKTELEAALAQIGDARTERRAEVLVELQDASYWLIDLPSLHRHAAEARVLGAELGRADVEVASMAYQASALGADGDLPTCIEAFDETLVRAGDAGVALPPAVQPLNCVARYWIGQLDRAVEIGHEAVLTAREANHGGAIVFAHSNLALALAGRGRYREAMDALEEAQRVGIEYGVHPHRARALAISSGFRNDLGDHAGAERYAEEARELARSLDFPPPAVSSGVDLLVSYARRGEVGRTEAILPWVEEMGAKAAGFHGWLWRKRLSDARAEIALARQRWDEALAHAQATVEESRLRPRPKYLARGLLTRARALDGLGRKGEALAELEQALETARKLGDPALELRVLASHLALEGSDELAREARDRANAIREALGPGPERDAFDACDMVRGLAN